MGQEKARDLASHYIQNFECYTDTEEGRQLVVSGPTLKPVLL